MFSIRTILHPTDFSEPSEFAFRVAGALARDHQAQLIILHVAPMPAFAFGQAIVLPEHDGYPDALEDKIQQFQSSDYPIPLDYQTREGNPAGAILQVAKEAHADLIVMGTHGRRGLSRLLMGSVAEQVVRDASCPVLTVKTPVAATPSELGRNREEWVSAHEASSADENMPGLPIF
jgi:nucleotide-binding universal stress UspA family protein